MDKLPAESQFALLDLLDGHRSFYEKHLDCDIDLHQLVPVLTANDLEKVSPILRDRCDLMPMYGYTPAEKKAIAQQAMLPAALKKYGLPMRCSRKTSRTFWCAATAAHPAAVTWKAC